jgi:glycerophosphoryl diester phosphodiesterase
MHRTDWNGGLVVLFHRFDRVAFGWDMQYEHELLAGFRMGLDALYSDHPDVMNDVFSTEIA